MYYETGQFRGKGSYSNVELDGLFEFYHENGQLQFKGTYSNGERCGEWIEDGETVTYPPCPNG
jgi:antitoxin component YwqK of YwqJK toxin-antitoxin module